MSEAIRLRSSWLSLLCYGDAITHFTGGWDREGGYPSFNFSYAIESTFGFLLVYLLGGLDLFPFASQPYPRPLYFSYVVKNKTRNHCRKRVLGLLPCLPATNSSLFSCTGDHESWGNSFSTFSLWRLYRTDRRSFCGFFFHLPKMLQKSMPEIILLLLVMCNF